MERIHDLVVMKMNPFGEIFFFFFGGKIMSLDLQIS